MLCGIEPPCDAAWCAELEGIVRRNVRYWARNECTVMCGTELAAMRHNVLSSRVARRKARIELAYRADVDETAARAESAALSQEAHREVTRQAHADWGTRTRCDVTRCAET
eukprot:739497-Rhodomonas_salina.1